MKVYYIYWTETVEKETLVEAESEAKAKLAFLDGHVMKTTRLDSHFRGIDNVYCSDES